MKPNINEILGLIQTREPQVLEQLGNKYQNYRGILKPGKTLGGPGEGPKDPDELLVRAEVCISGLTVVLHTCDETLPNLKRRLKKLGNIQFATQLLIALSGATLVSQNENAIPGLKMIAGALALGGSLLTLYFQHKSGTITNSESLFTCYDKLVDSKFEAESLKQEIDIALKVFDKNGPTDKLFDMITAGNKICLEIRKIIEKT